jgi:hypothetical protein
MRLYEKGALYLDDPMAMYLPEGLIRGIHVYRGKDYSHSIWIRNDVLQATLVPQYAVETAALIGTFEFYRLIPSLFRRPESVYCRIYRSGRFNDSTV